MFKALFLAALVLPSLLSSSAHAQEARRDGYHSWAEFEMADSKYRTESARPAPGSTMDLTGWETGSEKFMELFRRNLSDRNIPDRYKNFTPFGWDEQKFRDARHKAYTDARAVWQQEFRSDYQRQEDKHKQNRVVNEFYASRPEAQVIRDTYGGGAPGNPPRPNGLVVLGYGAEHGSPHEGTVRSMFGMQEISINKQDLRKNVVLTEGSTADLQKVLELIANHSGDKKLMINLVVGLEPSAADIAKGLSSATSGVRAATALAKFFASSPELLETLKQKGIMFSVFNEQSRAGYATLESYLESDAWKKKNRELSAAQKEVGEPKFLEKVAKLEALEKELKDAKTSAAYDKAMEAIIKLRTETSRTFARAHATDIVNELVLELPSTIKKSATAEILVNRVNENIAAGVGVKDTRSSGSKVDPAKAAKAARVAK